MVSGKSRAFRWSLHPGPLRCALCQNRGAGSAQSTSTSLKKKSGTVRGMTCRFPVAAVRRAHPGSAVFRTVSRRFADLHTSRNPSKDFPLGCPWQEMSWCEPVIGWARPGRGRYRPSRRRPRTVMMPARPMGFLARVLECCEAATHSPIEENTAPLRFRECTYLGFKPCTFSSLDHDDGHETGGQEEKYHAADHLGLLRGWRAERTDRWRGRETLATGSPVARVPGTVFRPVP